MKAPEKGRSRRHWSVGSPKKNPKLFPPSSSSSSPCGPNSRAAHWGPPSTPHQTPTLLSASRLYQRWKNIEETVRISQTFLFPASAGTVKFRQEKRWIPVSLGLKSSWIWKTLGRLRVVFPWQSASLARRLDTATEVWLSADEESRAKTLDRFLQLLQQTWHQPLSEPLWSRISLWLIDFFCLDLQLNRCIYCSGQWM